MPYLTRRQCCDRRTLSPHLPALFQFFPSQLQAILPSGHSLLLNPAGSPDKPSPYHLSQPANIRANKSSRQRALARREEERREGLSTPLLPDLLRLVECTAAAPHNSPRQPYFLSSCISFVQVDQRNYFKLKGVPHVGLLQSFMWIVPEDDLSQRVGNEFTESTVISYQSRRYYSSAACSTDDHRGPQHWTIWVESLKAR